MTREESQSLAEELVLRMSRESFARRAMGWDDAATMYMEGVFAQANVIAGGGQLRSNSLVLLAACALEVLREAFVQLPLTPDQIRAEHPTGPGPGKSKGMLS